MGAWRATESVSLRTLRSTTPSTARPRAVDGALGFRFLYSNTKRRVLAAFLYSNTKRRVLAALHTPARSRQGDKNQKVGVNPLYPRHQRSMNPYIHLIIVLTLKQGPMCDRSGRRSRSSALLHQQAWEHAYESRPAKPAADLQCGRRP